MRVRIPREPQTAFRGKVYNRVMEFQGEISWLIRREGWTVDVPAWLIDPLVEAMQSATPSTVNLPAHIQWKAYITAIAPQADGKAWTVSLVPTGYPTREGVELTIADVEDAWIDVAPNVKRTRAGVVLHGADA